MPESDERSKISVADVDKTCRALRALAEVLEPLDRDAQLRVLEGVCVVIGEDWFARAFRRIRLGPTEEG